MSNPNYPPGTTQAAHDKAFADMPECCGDYMEYDEHARRIYCPRCLQDEEGVDFEPSEL